MKIHRIGPDYKTCQSIGQEAKMKRNIFNLFTFKGISKAEEWVVQKMYVGNPRDKRGDFFGMGGDNIVMTTHARTILEPIVKDVSEFLPLDLQGETIWALNLINRIDCLDVAHCEVERFEDGGGLMRIDKYSFFKDRLNKYSLFDITNFPVTTIFTTEGHLPPELEFKHVVESNNLKGLKFDEVWDSEKQ
jgi:hypothetical protein